MKTFLLYSKPDLKKWQTLKLYQNECAPQTPSSISMDSAFPKSVFKSINKALTSFLWNGKNSRVRIELIQRPKQYGSLALPKLCYYYWAANIQKLFIGSMLLTQIGATLKLYPVSQHHSPLWSLPASPFQFQNIRIIQLWSTLLRYGPNLDIILG